jgi:3-methyladenine DNA glycosylase AlkD
MRSTDIQSLLSDLEEKFRSHSNFENGLAMSRYMKGHFSFYGIKAPLRTEIKKEWLKGLPKDLSIWQRWELVHELWNKDQREFQYIAMEYINSWRQSEIDIDDIEQIKFLITHRSWWDTVDLLASTFLGKYLLKFPEQKQKIIGQWRHEDNLWLKRACLLFQLKYKQRTDVGLLKDLIRQYQPIKEFFIQKAIGWVLRQYSKTDPEAVKKFVDEIQLKGLAAKEATKYL